VQEWARRLEVFASSDEVRAELPFWLAQAAIPDARLPVDFPAGRPTCGSFDSLRRRLSETETEALRAAARRAGMKLGDLFVGVAARWLADKTGMRDCAVAVAGHGREDLFADVDLSRTVGWFQVYYPLRVEAAGLGAVRKQLARVPRNGIGHALLRYASPDRAVRDALAAVEAPQVSVNFMGDFGFGGTPNETDLFDVFHGPYGPPQDETGEWLYLLDVVPSIVRNELVMQINYSNNVHERETAEHMLDELLDLVHAVIAGSDLADGTV
jgi:non-ribosomal peptide synthase protein (TIGR01720 family)